MASFTKRNGKWKVTIRRKGHPPLYRTFTKKAPAEAWAREKENEITNGAYQDLKPLAQWTVERFMEKYKEEITVHKKTGPREARALKNVTRLLGKHTLDKLHTQHIVEYYDVRLGEGVVADTVRKELNPLSHALNIAPVIWDIPIQNNVVQLAKPALRQTKKLVPADSRDRRVSESEFEKILAEVDSPVIRAAFIVAIDQGMRRGEIIDMKEEHVDVSRHLVHIPETKTGVSRTIPLTERAECVLRELEVAEGGRYFTMHPDTLSHEFVDACRAANVNDCRFHDLRHEAISRLFELGLAIEEVALISGHKSWDMLKRYTHLSPESVLVKLRSRSSMDRTRTS